MGSSAASGFESEVGQELVRLNQVYEWIGERFEERKRELATAMQSIREYLQEVTAVESIITEVENTVKELFGVDRLDDERIKVDTCFDEVNRIKIKSGLVKERFSSEIDAALEKLKGKQSNLDTVKNQCGDLEGRFIRLHTAHAKFDTQLDTFANQLSTYETTYSQLQVKLVDKQSNLSSLINNKNDANQVTVDPLKLTKDSSSLHTLIKDLNSVDDQLLEDLTESGDYIIKHAADKTKISGKLTLIKADFDLIANSLNDGLKLVDDVQILAEDFNNSVTDLNQRLDQIDLKVKNLGVDAQNIHELDLIEIKTINECKEVMNTAVGSYNDIRQNLKANELIILPTCTTPEDLREAIDATSAGVKAARAECVSLLNSAKAFEVLQTDLNEFVGSRRAELDGICFQMSTQVNKLEGKAAESEALRCEISLREKDMIKLTEFLADKDIETVKDIKENWKELSDKSDKIKTMINECTIKAIGFDSGCKEIEVFLSQCKDKKSQIVNSSLEGENLAKLFDKRSTQISCLLEDDVSNKGTEKLSELEELGKDLKSVCHVDLELVDAKLTEKNQELDGLKNDLSEFLVTNCQSSKTVAEFSSKIEVTENEIARLDGEITIAGSCVATQALPTLVSIQEEVREIPGMIRECKDLAYSDKTLKETGLVQVKIAGLNERFEALDTRVETRIVETSTLVEEFNRFQADLTRLEEKMTSIQVILEVREKEKEMADKQKRVDEISLREKEASLEKVKKTLRSLEDELKAATEALISNGGMYKELESTVKSLSEKSGALTEMQAEEERFVREQSDMLVGLNEKIVKCSDDINQCGKEFEAVVVRQEICLGSSLVAKSVVGSIINEHEKYQEENLVPIGKEVDEINKESSEMFGVDVSKRICEMKGGSQQASADLIQLTCLELKLEKLNVNFNKLDGKIFI